MNNKIKPLLLSVATLLGVTGCGPVEPTTLNLEKTLNEFKAGIKLSSTIHEVHDNEESITYVQTASKTKEFSVIIFEDETRTNKDIHEYYIGQEDDEHIYSTRLNVNNEYNYYKVYNPFTYEYYKWEDGFDNVFLSLSKESFNKIDDLSYSLKEESLATISDGFSTLLYGNPGLELTSLNIVLKEDVLKLESTLKFEDSYTITTTSVVLEKGADVNMDYRSLPFDEVPDETWEEMLNKLNENNYTTVVENYEDDILDSTSIYYTEEDKVYWETGTYYTGYYLLDDGTIQEVYKQNDQFYKSGAPIEDGSLDELRPSLEISRACFDLNDGVYTLKSGVEGDSFALTILEAYADEFDEFTLTILEDRYVFENVSGMDKTVITFKDVGTTSCGFTKDTVLEPLPATTWEDVLEPTSYANLYSFVGEDLTTLPVPEGYNNWTFETFDVYAYGLSEAKESISDDVYYYFLDLIDAGYIVDEEFEGELFGGSRFLKETTKDGQEAILAVEVGTYYDYFAIGFGFIYE